MISERMNIPLNVNTLSEIEINKAIDILRSGYFTMGKECELFETEFSQYLNVRHSIMVNSGSSANLLACFALASPLLESTAKKPLKKGSEVIVPALTWPTTIWPVVQAGAIPVFVDIDPKTLQIDMNQVENAITDKTAAIFAVHVLGNAAPLDELSRIAHKHNLWLLEDTCESLGVVNNQKYVGTAGDIGTFSFYFSHHITTIEGGMVVTNDDNIADVLRCLRSHGWTRHMKKKKEIESKYADIDPRFLFIGAGFNLRPTEINAAIGRAQLPKLAEFNLRRNEVVNYWLKDLAHLIPNQIKPMEITATTQPAWFGFPVRCINQKTRNALRDHLENSGIETRPIICGNMLRQPALKDIEFRSIQSTLPIADSVMDNGLYWGCHPFMTLDEITYISKTVKEFFK